MTTLEHALYQLGRIDTLASQSTAVHRLDPRAKVLATAVYLVCVVSVPPHDLTRLAPFAIFPLALAAAGRVPIGYLISRVLIASPFAIAVGVLNPFFDTRVVWSLGPVPVTSGLVSFASILARFVLTAAGAIVLVCTTGITEVGLALQRLGAPRILATQVVFLYRYLFVLAREGLTLSRARALRSVGRRGLGARVYAALLGHLLIRTVERAERIHQAMMCRGFDGRIRSARALTAMAHDIAFAVGWSTLFVLMRIVDVPVLIGRLTVGGS